MHTPLAINFIVPLVCSWWSQLFKMSLTCIGSLRLCLAQPLLQGLFGCLPGLGMSSCSALHSLNLPQEGTCGVRQLPSQLLMPRLCLLVSALHLCQLLFQHLLPISTRPQSDSTSNNTVEGSIYQKRPSFLTRSKIMCKPFLLASQQQFIRRIQRSVQIAHYTRQVVESTYFPSPLSPLAKQGESSLLVNQDAFL